MPPTVTLTEEAVLRLAPDDKAVKTARDLVRKRSFSQQGVSADGTWLLARCQGSAVYELSIDLAVESAPVGRCTCPSRKFPCKHVLGLMLAYATTPETFAEREPPEELVAKRAKSAARAEKADKPKAPRKVNQAAQAKKAAAQRDGLDLLEKLVLDLVAGGQWFAPARLERLDRQAKQMSDAYLPGALVMLRRLALLGQRADLTNDQQQIEQRPRRLGGMGRRHPVHGVGDLCEHGNLLASVAEATAAPAQTLVARGAIRASRQQPLHIRR